MAGVARPHAGAAAAVLVHQAARVADVPVLVNVVGAVLREAAHDLRPDCAVMRLRASQTILCQLPRTVHRKSPCEARRNAMPERFGSGQLPAAAPGVTG